MAIDPSHFSLFAYALAHIVFWLALALALWRAPWWHLRDSRAANILFGATVIIALVWTMRAGFISALNLHLLGATLLTLMFGWAFAIQSLLVILAINVLNGHGSWAAYPLNAIVLVFVPVLLSHALFVLVDRKLPNHFFIYIFVCAFFGAALAMASAITTATLMHWLSGAHTLAYLRYNFYAYALLIMFPEAFLTGMFMTLFVLYRPHWVSTFDDVRYLKNH